MDEINIDEGSSKADLTVSTIADRPMLEQQLAIYSQLRLMNDSILSSSVYRRS